MAHLLFVVPSGFGDAVAHCIKFHSFWFVYIVGPAAVIEIEAHRPKAWVEAEQAKGVG